MKPIVSLVEKALAHRRSLVGVADERTNAYRVFDGMGDGLADVLIDSFADHWLVQTRDVPFPEALKQATGLGWQSLWWKRLEQQDKQGPQFMAGEEVPEFTILENGLTYQIDFRSGYSQGIFLDQRIQRGRIQATARAGQRVLNLFAYTCAFSVAAAAGGAQTESIDLSRPYLDWGKRNFEANGIDPTGHFFCRGDSFDWLRRLGNKGNRYDLVVLDPPTFSRNQEGKLWRVEKDYPALVEAALRVTAERGVVLCCTNHHGISVSAFKGMLQAGAMAAGRNIRSMQLGEMPPDFTGPPYLKVVWLQT